MENNTKRKWLLFTSAGDYSNILQWLDPIREYDIFVVYYGNTDILHHSKVDFYRKRKGGKFQNLYHFFHSENYLFEEYEAFLVFDDDIIISSSEINKLFLIMQESGLELLQPAYDRRGKISHKMTEFNPLTKLRITNFIEVGVPMFSHRALSLFLNKFDPRVNCFGVDWWFCFEIQKHFGRYTIGITDQVLCLNPYDQDKFQTGTREIDMLSSEQARCKIWEQVKTEKNLNFREDQFKIYFSIYVFSGRQLLSWTKIQIGNYLLRFRRKINTLSKNW